MSAFDPDRTSEPRQAAAPPKAFARPRCSPSTTASDWIATIPPTVRITAASFGRERANLVFGWVFAGHQIGAATAAFGAGFSRTVLSTYLPAFFIAGALCIIAAVLAVPIARPGSAAKMAASNLVPAKA